MQEIAEDLAVVPNMIVNAYLVGRPDSWVLVDGLTPGNAGRIKEAAAERFGAGSKPKAIVLTHGHFDHAGSARELAAFWQVPVHVHPLEFPYLTGRSKYPPLDPTAPGFFSALSRLFPSRTVDLEGTLVELNVAEGLPHVEGWQCHPTPGHTPGHVSFFRPADGTLLAGDAFTTVNQENLFALLAKRPEVKRPPVPATTDWDAARRSVQALANLKPRLLAAGHGVPMTDSAGELQQLARHFPVPSHGRYVHESARADETGVTYLPPPPPDPFPKIAAVLGAAAIAAAGASLIRKKR